MIKLDNWMTPPPNRLGPPPPYNLACNKSSKCTSHMRPPCFWPVCDQPSINGLSATPAATPSNKDLWTSYLHDNAKFLISGRRISWHTRLYIPFQPMKLSDSVMAISHSSLITCKSPLSNLHDHPVVLLHSWDSFFDDTHLDNVSMHCVLTYWWPLKVLPEN